MGVRARLKGDVVAVILSSDPITGWRTGGLRAAKRNLIVVRALTMGDFGGSLAQRTRWWCDELL
jgi:hypothetical protein